MTPAPSTPPPAAATPVPEYQYFDDVAQFRIYENSAVPAGKLRVTLVNVHPKDPVTFELWNTSNGHTFKWGVEGGGTQTADVSTPFIERLVWFGHTTKMLNKPLDPMKGWSLDFLRNNK